MTLTRSIWYYYLLNSIARVKFSIICSFGYWFFFCIDQNFNFNFNFNFNVGSLEMKKLFLLFFLSVHLYIWKKIRNGDVDVDFDENIVYWCFDLTGINQICSSFAFFPLRINGINDEIYHSCIIPYFFFFFWERCFFSLFNVRRE